MKPPEVWAETSPKSHRMSKTAARVQSMIISFSCFRLSVRFKHPRRPTLESSGALHPGLFRGAFCHVLEILAGLFDLLPGFFRCLVNLPAGALRRAFLFLAAREGLAGLAEAGYEALIAFRLSRN